MFGWDIYFWSIDAGAQVTIIILACGPCVVIVIVWDRFSTLGRAPCTKETLPDFREWCRVIRHPRVFRGLTGCQRTPGFGASQRGIRAKVNDYLGSSVGVVISVVLIPASQLDIRA